MELLPPFAIGQPRTDQIVTLVADPPWSYADKLNSVEFGKQGADSQYNTLDVQGIKDFLTTIGLVPRLAEDGFLFLWTTTPFLLDGTACDVVKAWGYTPKQMVTWTKGREDGDKLILKMGLGRYMRGVTEHLIFATRGRPSHLTLNHGVRNYFETNDEGVSFLAPSGRHSEKPEVAFQLIESLVPGPYYELFARKRRDGWGAFGDQLC